MADTLPNQTLYINNIYEKAKKEGGSPPAPPPPRSPCLRSLSIPPPIRRPEDRVMGLGGGGGLDGG